MISLILAHYCDLFHLFLLLYFAFISVPAFSLLFQFF
nr:MAG TPA: hypothetical protein [Caudoviricetes sp.]